MGTYNSGCALPLEVPVLNQAPNGPLLMVSHANTNPGLTKAWEAGYAGEVLPRAVSGATPVSSRPMTTRARRRPASPRRTSR